MPAGMKRGTEADERQILKQNGPVVGSRGVRDLRLGWEVWDVVGMRKELFGFEGLLPEGLRAVQEGWQGDVRVADVSRAHSGALACAGREPRVVGLEARPRPGANLSHASGTLS